MRTLALSLCAIVAAGWNLHDYNKHEADKDQSIDTIELQPQELPVAYQPALTEYTHVENVTNDAIWNKLGVFEGLETYTHAHHGSDITAGEPTEDHEYPSEHSHYRSTHYNDRRPVYASQARKVYHVKPVRYTRSYDVESDEEEEYVPNIFFPTTKPDTVASAKHQRSFREFEEPLVDSSSAGSVPANPNVPQIVRLNSINPDTTTVKYQFCSACRPGQRHSPEKILFSNTNRKNKWYAGPRTQQSWVTFDFDEYKDITGFGFVSGWDLPTRDPKTARVQIWRDDDWFDVAMFTDLKTEWDGARRSEISRDLPREWRTNRLRIRFENIGAQPNRGIQLETVKFFGYE